MVNDDFFATLPTITGFERIGDPDSYRPVPDDWDIGVADVIGSTDAIVKGRYKAVNTAGAAVISAISNALGTLDFPFVFTGDGMCYAVGPGQAGVARQALAASVGWIESELGLQMRGGALSVAAVRAAGKDVRVARFAPSANVAYAMFSGGGLAWIDAALKAGHLEPLAISPDMRPDLNGLSCRFKPVRARNGLIVSLIVRPMNDLHDPSFTALVNDVVALAASEGERTKPVDESSLKFRWPPQALVQEARLGRREGEPLLFAVVRVVFRTLVAVVILVANRDVGGFSPRRYKEQLVENSDFRKYEDGLMMTLDCSDALAGRIEARLVEARAAGVADFGLHRQTSALITCFVPSPSRPDHVHFVDGAAGGYALASRALKQSRNSATSWL